MYFTYIEWGRVEKEGEGEKREERWEERGEEYREKKEAGENLLYVFQGIAIKYVESLGAFAGKIPSRGVSLYEDSVCPLVALSK